MEDTPPTPSRMHTCEHTEENKELFMIWSLSYQDYRRREAVPRCLSIIWACSPHTFSEGTVIALQLTQL